MAPAATEQPDATGKNGMDAEAHQVTEDRVALASDVQPGVPPLRAPLPAAPATVADEAGVDLILHSQLGADQSSGEPAVAARLQLGDSELAQLKPE